MSRIPRKEAWGIALPHSFCSTSVGDQFALNQPLDPKAKHVLKHVLCGIYSEPGALKTESSTEPTWWGGICPFVTQLKHPDSGKPDHTNWILDTLKPPRFLPPPLRCRCGRVCKCGLADALGRAKGDLSWSAAQPALQIRNLHPDVTEDGRTTPRVFSGVGFGEVTY